MVNDPAAKAERYRAQRAALAPQRGVRFVHLPDGPPAPAGAFAVKRVAFIRHGRLRRGPSVILPPAFSFVWRIPMRGTNSIDE